MPVDQLKRFLSELRIAPPFSLAQAMFDIRSGLGFVQGVEMVGRDNALAQLFELRVAQDRAKLRLPKQKAL
jgi:hypothetical protein